MLVYVVSVGEKNKGGQVYGLYKHKSTAKEHALRLMYERGMDITKLKVDGGYMDALDKGLWVAVERLEMASE